MPNNNANSEAKCNFCASPLAVSIDEFLYHHSFVEWKGFTGEKSITYAKPSNYLQSLTTSLIEQEFQEQHKAEIAKLGITQLMKLAGHGSASPSKRLQTALNALANLRQDYVRANKENPKSFISVTSTSDALRLLSARFRETHNFLLPGYQDDKKAISAMTEKLKKQPMPFSVGSLGFMFLERLRIRSLGHTLDRSPLYALTLTPGQVTTLRQRTFTKRVSTIEESQEDVEEQKIESSATFSTEFSQEFERSAERTTSWGVQQSASVGAQVKVVELKGQTDGTYSQTDTLKEATREFSKVLEQIARKVETNQKSTHKIVMSVSTENTFEQESTRIFRNDDVVSKKYLFRKVYQVLHASYERYGVKACWIAHIKDPARELRELVLTPEKFPDEWTMAKERWASAAPPATEASLPGNRTVSTGFVTVPYGANDHAFQFSAPNGYEFLGASTEHFGGGHSEVINGECLCGNRYPYPAVGATNFILYVHTGLGADEDDGSFYVNAIFQPVASIRAEYEARVAEWRSAQTQREFLKLLAPRYDEIMASIPKTWPPMVAMRRIAKENFGLPGSFEEVDFLQRVFDWENMGIVYDPPAYDPNPEPSLFQCIPTDPFNASWAKVYVPFRPGCEEEAVSFLAATGQISSSPSNRDQIEYYLAQMTNVFEPRFTRSWIPTDADRDEIQSPAEITLTPCGDDDWLNEFEKAANFDVLDRFLLTIPTDGVDIEESEVLCEMPTEMAQAAVKEKVERAEMLAELRERVGNGDGTITISVTPNT